MPYPRAIVAQTASETTFRNLLVARDGAAATITLNRPEKRNALSLELMEELIAALELLGAEREVRAIVIAGAGPAFSAGHDLAEMVDRDAAFYERLFDICTVMMETIHRVPQPVIAKVHATATTRSHDATSWQPAAVAVACTFAITGCGTRWIVSIITVQTSNRRS